MINRSMDALEWLRKQLETDDNDLPREMVRSASRVNGGIRPATYPQPRFAVVFLGWDAASIWPDDHGTGQLESESRHRWWRQRTTACLSRVGGVPGSNPIRSTFFAFDGWR